MSVIMFTTVDQSGQYSEYAGCVCRIVCAGPFHKVVQDQQSGQPVRVVDFDKALQWLMGQDISFPQGCGFKKYALNAAMLPDHQKPQVLIVQEARPAVAPHHVQSGQPYGPPYGNGGGELTPPPVAGQVGSDRFEELPDVALARNQDGFLDADEMGGTWADVDSQGNEEKRQNFRTFQPRPDGK